MKRNFLFLLRLVMVALFFRAEAMIFAEDLSGLPPPYRDLEYLYPFDDFGWFGIENQQTIKKIIKKNNVQTVVELGSLLGKSTRFIAECLPENGKVYAVDHWLGSIEHNNPKKINVYPKLDTLYERFLSNIIHVNLCHKIIPIRATTLEAVDLIFEQPDLVFVDASHEYEDVLNDLEAWYPRVRKNGILCGDDWDWGKDFPIQKAVKHFAEKNNLKYVVLCGKMWVIIVK